MNRPHIHQHEDWVPVFMVISSIVRSQTQQMRSAFSNMEVRQSVDCHIASEMNPTHMKERARGDDKQYITVMSQWAPWRLNSPASRVLAQPFVEAHIKENIKAPPCHWTFWGNPPVTGGFSSQRPVTRIMFPFADVIMTKAKYNHAYTVCDMFYNPIILALTH